MILLPIMLVSCSDDDPVGPGKDSILPVTLGSYWIYENYNLDESYNRLNKFTGLDSSIISGTTVKLGKNASVMTKYTQNRTGVYEKEDDDFYYIDGSKLYVHTDYIKNMMSIMSSIFQIDEKWLLIANENDEDWTVLEQDIDTFPLIATKIWGHLTMRDTKGGTVTLAVNGKDYTAQEYTLDVDFEGKVLYLKTEIEKSYKVKIHLWFAKGVGLIKSIVYMPAVSLGNYSMAQSITESYLKNFRIK